MAYDKSLEKGLKILAEIIAREEIKKIFISNAFDGFNEEQNRLDSDNDRKKYIKGLS